MDPGHNYQSHSCVMIMRTLGGGGGGGGGGLT